MEKMKAEKMMKPLLLLMLMAMGFGCHIPSDMGYFNISSSYDEQIKSFDLKCCAYNQSELQVQVFYKFNTSALLFIKHKKKDYFFAKYQMKYEVYDNSQPKVLVDSASV